MDKTVYRVVLFVSLYAIAATCMGFANLVFTMEVGDGFSPAGLVIASLVIAGIGTFGIFSEDEPEERR